MPQPNKQPAKGRLGGIWEKVPSWAKGAFGTVAVIVLAVFAVNELNGGGGGNSGEPSFPRGGPAEFLYLDAGRAASYLAQINRGGYSEEKVIRKLADSLSAKLPTPAGGEAGVTRANEILTERVLQPTEASSFFSLMDKLEDGHIQPVEARNFRGTFEGLDEGTFVTFHTSEIVAPRYMNAFLALRQATTLEALFPNSAARRRAARGFFEDVGRNARAVFAIRPTYKREPDRRKDVVYLLPIRTKALTAERSLIKYGGGRFTVVGKVIRDFPESELDHRPAYIDSPTLETWEQPLKRAPGELLCRTEQQCVDEVRSGEVEGKVVSDEPLEGKQRDEALNRARERILETLKSQTTIERRGAVILPIAIYK